MHGDKDDCEHLIADDHFRCDICSYTCAFSVAACVTSACTLLLLLAVVMWLLLSKHIQI